MFCRTCSLLLKEPVPPLSFCLYTCSDDNHIVAFLRRRFDCVPQVHDNRRRAHLSRRVLQLNFLLSFTVIRICFIFSSCPYVTYTSGWIPQLRQRSGPVSFPFLAPSGTANIHPTLCSPPLNLASPLRIREGPPTW